MEINGFKIEQYNVHGIPAKAKSHTCPKCSETRKKKKDKCMSVYWDTGLGHCNHCGETVQLHTYQKKNPTREYKKPAPKPKSQLSERVVSWFQDDRGISEQTLIDLKITEGVKWMPKAKKEILCIEFNYYLFGELVNIKSRGKDKDFKFEKDCELIMYNLDAIKSEPTCVIVEGEPDTLAFHEAGVKNVTSVPNGFTLPKPDGTSTINLSFLDDYYGLFEDKEKIYIAVDNDLPGEEGKKELIRRFGAEKCFLVDFKDCKDANDYLLKYGKEELANTIALAKPVPLEGIVTIRDVEQELDDFWANGAPKGMTIDLDGFDDCASFVFKQYTLVVSAPGSGKSDFIDFILTKMALKYDLKAGICSTENQPLHFHYDKIIKKILGGRPSKDNCKSGFVEQSKSFVAEHFFHVNADGRFYLEDVLDKFKQLVHRKGVRLFVLDPFNKIKLKKSDRSNTNAYTEEYHMMLDDFCKKHDAHIFLVLHPVKISKKEGSDKTFIMPTAYDCKGGGEHFDMSYNILGMVRDHERNLVQIRTLKWKFQHLGKSGVDNWFGWNINNGRYTSVEGGYDDSFTHTPKIVWDNTNWLSGVEVIEPEEEYVEKPLPKPSPQDAFDGPDVERDNQLEDEVPF